MPYFKNGIDKLELEQNGDLKLPYKKQCRN